MRVPATLRLREPGFQRTHSTRSGLGKLLVIIWALWFLAQCESARVGIVQLLALVAPHEDLPVLLETVGLARGGGPTQCFPNHRRREGAVELGTLERRGDVGQLGHGPQPPILAATLCAFATAPVTSTAFGAESDAGTIEEIVVTSRRRAESAQDVPIAVTAFNPDDLERINPDTLRDIDGRMPNVFIGRQTAGPQMGAIYIRGLGYADVERFQRSGRS